MEILQLIGGVLEIGLPAILLYQLYHVWNRLNIVTDKLINLTEEFEAYREQSTIERAQMVQQIKANQNA